MSKITSKRIDATNVDVLIAGKPIIIWDSELRGFGVRLSPANKRYPDGKISYLVQKRAGGRGSREIRVTFEAVDVGAARDKAISLIASIRNGENPSKRKKDLLALRRQEYAEFRAKKFKDIFERYRKERTDGSYYWEKDIIWGFNKYVLPSWGSSAITEITKEDCKSLLKSIPKQSSARRIEQQLKPMFKWALEQDIITTNPFDGIKPQPKGASRDRVLQPQELQAFWKATGEMIGWGKPIFGHMYRALLLSAARLREIAHLEHAELHLQVRVINIAANRTKNSKVHVIPLSGLLIEVLQAAPNRHKKYVYSYGRGPLGGFSPAKANLDKLMQKYLGEQFKPWHNHDLRHTFATIMASQGANPDIIDRCLGHVSKGQEGVRGIYQRYEFLKERGEVMQQWSDYIERLVGGKQ
jgi:integrase